VQADNLLMVCSGERRVKDSVGKFLHTPGTGEDVKEISENEITINKQTI